MLDSLSAEPINYDEKDGLADLIDRRAAKISRPILVKRQAKEDIGYRDNTGEGTSGIDSILKGYIGEGANKYATAFKENWPSFTTFGVMSLIDDPSLKGVSKAIGAPFRLLEGRTKRDDEREARLRGARMRVGALDQPAAERAISATGPLLQQLKENKRIVTDEDTPKIPWTTTVGQALNPVRLTPPDSAKNNLKDAEDLLFDLKEGRDTKAAVKKFGFKFVEGLPVLGVGADDIFIDEKNETAVAKRAALVHGINKAISENSLVRNSAMAGNLAGTLVGTVALGRVLGSSFGVTAGTAPAEALKLHRANEVSMALVYGADEAARDEQAGGLITTPLRVARNAAPILIGEKMGDWLSDKLLHATRNKTLSPWVQSTVLAASIAAGEGVSGGVEAALVGGNVFQQAAEEGAAAIPLGIGFGINRRLNIGSMLKQARKTIAGEDLDLARIDAELAKPDLPEGTKTALERERGMVVGLAHSTLRLHGQKDFDPTEADNFDIALQAAHEAGPEKVAEKLRDESLALDAVDGHPETNKIWAEAKAVVDDPAATDEDKSEAENLLANLDAAAHATVSQHSDPPQRVKADPAKVAEAQKLKAAEATKRADAQVVSDLARRFAEEGYPEAAEASEEEAADILATSLSPRSATQSAASLTDKALTQRFRDEGFPEAAEASEEEAADILASVMKPASSSEPAAASTTPAWQVDSPVKAQVNLRGVVESIEQGEPGYLETTRPEEIAAGTAKTVQAAWLNIRTPNGKLEKIMAPGRTLDPSIVGQSVKVGANPDIAERLVAASLVPDAASVKGSAPITSSTELAARARTQGIAELFPGLTPEHKQRLTAAFRDAASRLPEHLDTSLGGSIGDRLYDALVKRIGKGLHPVEGVKFTGPAGAGIPGLVDGFYNDVRKQAQTRIAKETAAFEQGAIGGEGTKFDPVVLTPEQRAAGAAAREAQTQELAEFLADALGEEMGESAEALAAATGTEAKIAFQALAINLGEKSNDRDTNSKEIFRRMAGLPPSGRLPTALVELLKAPATHEITNRLFETLRASKASILRTVDVASGRSDAKRTSHGSPTSSAERTSSNTARFKLESGSAVTALEAVATDPETPEDMRLLAKAIKGVIDPKAKMVADSGINGGGEWSAAGGSKVNPRFFAAQVAKDIIHEAGHEVLVHKTEAFLAGDYTDLSPAEIEAFIDLTSLMAHARSTITAAEEVELLRSRTTAEFASAFHGSLSLRNRLYGLINLHEFITETLTNREFQRFLNGIDGSSVPMLRPSESKGLWGRIKNALRRALGIKEDAVLAKAFDRAIDLLSEENSDASYGSTEIFGSLPSVEETKSQVFQRLPEAIRRLNIPIWDPRSINDGKQFAREFIDNNGGLEDSAYAAQKAFDRREIDRTELMAVRQVVAIEAALARQKIFSEPLTMASKLALDHYTSLASQAFDDIGISEVASNLAGHRWYWERSGVLLPIQYKALAVKTQTEKLTGGKGNAKFKAMEGAAERGRKEAAGIARDRLTQLLRKNLETAGLTKEQIKTALADAPFAQLSEEIYKTLSDRNATSNDLVKAIAESGLRLTPEQAAKVAGAVRKSFNDAVQEATQREFEKLNKRYNILTLKKEGKTLGQRYLDFANLGLYQREDFYNALAPHFNLATWDPEFLAQMEKDAAAVQAMPEGSIQRNEATTKHTQKMVMQQLKDRRGVGLLAKGIQLLNATWVADVLSGIPTQLVNAGWSQVSVLGELTAQAAGSAIAAHKMRVDLGQKANWGLEVGFFKDLFKALSVSTGKAFENPQLRADHNRLFQEATAAVTKGTTIIKSTKMEDLGPLENYGFRSFGSVENAGDAVKFLPRNMLSALKYVGRVMLASDVVNSLIAQTGNQLMNARLQAIGDEEVPGVIERYEFFAPEAHEQVEAEGLTGNDAKRRFAQIMEQKVYSAEQLEEGSYFAAKATFNNDYEGVIGFSLSMFNKISGVIPPLKWAIPFTKTLSAMLNQGIDWSPLGVARAHNLSITNLASQLPGSKILGKYQHQLIERGSADYYAQMARAAVGSAFWVTLFAALVNAWEHRDDKERPWFDVSGPGPEDPALKLQLISNGWEARTVFLGKLKVKTSDMPFGIGTIFASIGEVMDRLKYADEESSAGDIATSAALGVLKGLFDRNLLQGVNRMSTALSGKGKEQETAFKQFFGGAASGYVPFSGALRWTADTFTKTQPDYKQESQWILMTPVAHAISGKPAFNVWGDDITDTVVTPTTRRFGGLVKTDARIEKLMPVGLILPKAQRSTRNLKGERMNQDAYYKYARTFHKRLSELMTDDRIDSVVSRAKAGLDVREKAQAMPKGEARDMELRRAAAISEDAQDYLTRDMAKAARDWARSRVK